MVRRSKRARLAIEVVLVHDDDEDQEPGEDRGVINIEDVNVQMYDVSSSDSDELPNNNYIDQEEEPVEEAGQLDDTQVSEADPDPENEEDDEGFQLHPCDWCNVSVRDLIMVDEEDICGTCVRDSDLERNENGEWGYPKRQFEDSENAEDDVSEPSDLTIIELSDTDTEDEAEQPDGEAQEREDEAEQPDGEAQEREAEAEQPDAEAEER